MVALMSMLLRTRCVLQSACFGGLILSLAFMGPCKSSAQAPAPSSTLEGVVVDPMGARVAHASVHIQPDDPTSHIKPVTTDRTGHFAIALPRGFYQVTVESPGFEPFRAMVTVPAAGPAVHLDVALAIPALLEEVVVDPDSAANNSADENKSALVFSGKDLKIFSDDNATFQKQMEALAGGGPKAPQVYVNGFSGGRFPPKNTIASIRFNRNPYSSLYDAYGQGRIEIVTKPGTDQLHGAFEVLGNDIRLNTANPYSGAQPPPYDTLTVDGNINGPIGKKTSFFLAGNYNNQQNNAAVDALYLDSNFNQAPFIQAVPDPQIASTYSARLDRQMTSTNTFTGSYQFNQASLTNGSVGLLVLPTEGFNNGTTTQLLQLSDTQLIGMKMSSETRFQYVRTRLQQDPLSSGTTIIAQGAFNGGGNPQQQLRDNQDFYEFQELFSRQQGAHFFRMGGRYRLYRDANLSRANFNGEFIFPSLSAYALTLQNVKACAENPPAPTCLTPAQLLAVGGGPSEYSITTGQSSATILTGDLAVFAEDEWKFTKNLTFDLGFRFESQSAIPDHVDPAPRIGVAWAVHRKKSKATLMTLRTGAGVFYDRFTAANLLTSVRQNGVSQQTFVETNPDYSNPVATPVPPTVYTVDPNLRTEYGIYTGASAERVFGKFGRASVTYTAIRGNHQYLSRNINAPLPGTYDPTVPSSGTRPLGGSQNIYQFDSSGVLNDNQIAVNGRFNLSKRVVAYVVYSARRENSDASNASSFVSNSYNPRADYGRVALPSQIFYTGGNIQLPFGLTTNLYFSAQKGTPFNITTGTDLNGDTQYNDRPTFATDLSRPSVVKTVFGNFDTSPIAGQTLVPINYGNSPSFVFLDLSLARSFAVGPRPAVPAAKPGAKPQPRPDPPYSLNFTVDAQNIFNHVNPGPPVGVLSSTLFGKPNSLNNVLTTNTAANRVVTLQMSFQF
jgi:hypothetical protein